MVKWGQTTNYAGTPIPPRPPSIAYIIIKKKEKENNYKGGTRPYPKELNVVHPLLFNPKRQNRSPSNLRQMNRPSTQNDPRIHYFLQQATSDYAFFKLNSLKSRIIN
jgi:hypothetical protein